LGDDHAEAFVGWGVQVDAVVVARLDVGAGVDEGAGASVRDRRVLACEVAGPLDLAGELLRE
jgi:hypothetical protein